jgi:hypothetical protein
MNNNACCSDTINALHTATNGLVQRISDRKLREDIFNLYDADIREFMRDEILGDNQISFDTFLMYWQKTYPILKLICFTRYLVPFNERKNDRYTVEKKILNEEFNGQFLPSCYIVLTTDKTGTGAGHYKLVRADDEPMLLAKLKSTDAI